VQTVYIVKGTDANGCINYDSVTVNITGLNKGGYFMPTGFTPNNDGLNDCYGVRYWGVIEELDFGIYNRWGERIFHTTTPGACWDGTYKGEKQNPDVYVYLITAKTTCGKVFRKGTFVLIR
jgi:gliding motility-associated-like protein